MKLENQVCTKEQADKLKELGVIQKSLFYFHPSFPRPVVGTGRINLGKVLREVCNDKDVAISAYTVAELFQMLPDYYPSWRFKHDTKKWIVTHICGPKPEGADNIHTAYEFDRYEDTQAQALATLLIALLEEKVIDVKGCNDRLQE